jgi:preprotein translocase subunit SecF
MSINGTLSRTLITSLSTLIVVFALYVYGGEVIKDFAFALIIGILVGTYSSIYVASPMLLVWNRLFQKEEA